MPSLRCSSELKRLRLKAGLSQNKLAREADLDRNTVSSAESGKWVAELSASKMVQALSRKLGTKLKISDILEP